MDKALATAGYADLAAKKAEAKARGKLLGFGLSTYIEVCGVAPVEVDRRRRRGLGRRDVGVGQHQGPPDRQGRRHDGHPAAGPGPRDDVRPGRRHELGIPMEDIVVQHSDTQGTPFGYGSYGSRTSSVGMTAAIKAADKIREKARALRGAHARGVASTTSRSTAPSTASRARPTRRRRSRRSPSRSTSRSTRPRAWSRTSTRRPTTTRRTAPGRSGPTSRSSRSTRRPACVDLVRYVAVDDVGKKINPMIVDGQLHGGIAQGVGQALWEGAIYSDDGPAPVGLDARLRAAAGLVAPELRARRDRHAVAGQPARRQGRRRGRRDRQHGRGGQRRHRRAEPARHPPSRHAATPPPDGVAAPSSPRREARHDPGSVRLPAAGQRR